MIKKIDFHIGNLGKGAKNLILEDKVYFCNYLTEKLEEKFPNHEINVMYGSGVNYFEKLHPSEVIEYANYVFNDWKN